MLIELSGTNYGCFRDEFTLSMLASDIDPKSSRGIAEVKLDGEDKPLRLLRAAAIYGPNASGKSTVIKAAGTLRKLISEEGASKKGLGEFYMPFLLGPSRGQPCRLGIKAVVTGKVYEYACEFDAQGFVVESLSQHLKKDERVLFRREGAKVHGEWSSDEKFKLLSQDMRPELSLLRTVDRFAKSLTGTIVQSMCDVLGVFDMAKRTGSTDEKNIAKRVDTDPKFRVWLLEVLKFADLGIQNVRTVVSKPAEERIGFFRQMEIELDNMKSASQITNNNYPDKTVAEVYYSLKGKLKSSLKIESDELSLAHTTEDGEVYFDFEQESFGTQWLTQLAPIIYSLLHSDSPKAVFVDEIDSSLHPTVLSGLIHKFNCETPLEDVKGQLIFTTHETALLEGEAKDAILRRDQIYLTQKDSSGAAKLYSVADFNERQNLNVRRRYLQGRYGALPALGM